MHNLDSDSEDELPPGWEEKSTDDGNVYYLNSCNKKTQWTHPRTGRKKVIPKDLPFGWTKTVDNGQTLYVNQETGHKTYVDPRLAFSTEEKKHVNDFRQRFDGSTTAFQVLHGVDLSGKYALITGCNAGIGYETAKSLARHGCNVLLANRNLEATQKAIEDIVKETKASEDCLKSIHLDLSSLKSVKKCALAVKTLFSDHIDMLILNAGVFGLPYEETEDGLDRTFQVNHLSHMYLTLLLEPLLKKGSRVVFLSSESHRTASLKNVFVKQNLAHPKEQYSAMTAYGNSKLYNIITARILSEEWKEKGIAVNSLHPGNMVSTNLQNSWWVYRLVFFMVRPFTKSLIHSITARRPFYQCMVVRSQSGERVWCARSSRRRPRRCSCRRRASWPASRACTSTTATAARRPRWPATETSRGRCSASRCGSSWTGRVTRSWPTSRGSTATSGAGSQRPMTSRGRDAYWRGAEIIFSYIHFCLKLLPSSRR